MVHGRARWVTALATTTAALALTACTSDGKKSPGASGGSGQSTSGAPGNGTVSGSASPGGVEGVTGTASATCKFASAAQISAAFGGPVSSQSPGVSGTGVPICRFVLSASNVGPPGSVTVTSNSKASSSVFDQSKQANPGAEAVTGLADDAFYLPATSTLQLLKGKTIVIVSATIRVPGSAQTKPDLLKADIIAFGKAVAATI